MAEGKPPVIDWDRVVNKNVRSKEGEPIGNIVAHMGFDGAEVTLNLTANELAKFALGGGP
jgi:hypothetical protein